jgi:hypothetical protein
VRATFWSGLASGKPYPRYPADPAKSAIHYSPSTERLKIISFEETENGKGGLILASFSYELGRLTET